MTKLQTKICYGFMQIRKVDEGYEGLSRCTDARTRHASDDKSVREGESAGEGERTRECEESKRARE